ncbi:efflux RND transporter periplasmic adaptor subunit [Kineobactrum salinum]|uniref:Efflux RND transporter periplasmic adaptor subunit n=1 Tax=Kineobactrum salinum TaxID=2708301 RepID=A0A6C0U591_9GAMM|nr:efflux RND transporter periplasmic adaptor subunit [Kineobactrum salinum]QIB67330.1 efflux RND transporter periplasmic adaptor subunit [Kineobactrum salinum]
MLHPLSSDTASRHPTWLLIALACVLVAVLSAILHLRAGFADQPPTPEPLPVRGIDFVLEPGFVRSLRFTGVVRARDQSEAGFELPGMVRELAVEEGDRLTEGAVIARLDTSQLKARRRVAAADLTSVEAELELARLRAERQRKLRASGAVSVQDYDATRLAAQALEGRLASLAAQLQSIDIDLHKSVLHAPWNGVVAQRYLDTGAIVAAGTPVVRLLRTEQLEARIGIPTQHLHALQTGREYRLLLRTGPVAARLRAVHPDVEPLTRTALAVFVLPDANQSLDGEPVSLLLKEEIASEGGWLPVSALLEGERGAWSVLRLQAREASTVAVREMVEVLEIDGDRAFVRGSLQSGQTVIADGIHRIAAGTPVRPLER